VGCGGWRDGRLDRAGWDGLGSCVWDLQPSARLLTYTLLPFYHITHDCLLHPLRLFLPLHFQACGELFDFAAWHLCDCTAAAVACTSVFCLVTRMSLLLPAFLAPSVSLFPAGSLFFPYLHPSDWACVFIHARHHLLQTLPSRFLAVSSAALVWPVPLPPFVLHGWKRTQMPRRLQNCKTFRTATQTLPSRAASYGKFAGLRQVHS